MARTAYWVAHPTASWPGTPTGAQIAAGNLSNSNAADFAGSEEFAATSGTGQLTEQTAVSGASSNTQYTIAWVIYDDVADDYSGVATGTITTAAVYNESIYDPAGATDAPAAAATLAASASDSASATESASAAVTTGSASVAESASATDAPSATATLAASVTEPASASDETSAFATFLRTITESASSVDATDGSVTTAGAPTLSNLTASSITQTSVRLTVDVEFA